MEFFLERKGTPMAQAGVNPKRKLRVLIADDIQETRRNTRLMISMIDNLEMAAIASNGLQAVEMAEEKRPDILLLDVNMPKMNGLEAYKQIKQVLPGIGCIIISAEKDSETLQEAMSLGIRDYLFKPFTLDQLEEAVENVSARLVKNHQDTQQRQQLLEKNEDYLKQLAHEYTKNRRTDDKALEVYEQLAANPTCEPHWLHTLAMVYVVRQEWGKLKDLSIRLEQQAKNTTE